MAFIIKLNQAKNCIKLQGGSYEMELINSDLAGFYLYKLLPLELGYENKIIYIAPDRKEHWLYGKPLAGGKKLDNNLVSYFKS